MLEFHFSFLFSVATRLQVATANCNRCRRGKVPGVAAVAAVAGAGDEGAARGRGDVATRRRVASPHCRAALGLGFGEAPRRPCRFRLRAAVPAASAPGEQARPASTKAGSEHPPCGSTHARPASALTGSEHARWRRAGMLAAGTNVGSEHGEPSERTHRKRARTPATPGEPARLRRERTPAASIC